MIFSATSEPFRATLRPVLFLALLPFALSGCIFSEMDSEEIEIIFQSDGTVRYLAAAAGPAEEDLMDMTAAELADFVAHFNEEFSAGIDDLFDGQVTTATGDFSDLSRIALQVEGVFSRTPSADLDRMGQVFPAHPLVISPDLWSVALLHNNTLDWPLTVCISLAPEWRVDRQGQAFPPLASGERTCANWTELQIQPSDMVIVEYTP